VHEVSDISLCQKICRQIVEKNIRSLEPQVVTGGIFFQKLSNLQRWDLAGSLITENVMCGKSGHGKNLL
jgi:hypothetical protein